MIAETRILASIATAAVLVGGYHFLPVVGPHARLERAHTAIAAKNTALRGAAAALEQASKAIAARDRAIIDNAAQERVSAETAGTFWKGQCRHAFDAGYAARNCADPALPARLRDLRALQAAGAYKAPAGVPRKP